MTVYERPFGRYFEDFEPGDVYKHWPGKTITEYDDHLFCMITMNHHPLHTDAWYAETQTQFGKNVVVGNLVYSLVLGMSVPDVSGAAIANLEVEELKHKMPTFHGDTIYAETKVLEKKESSSKPDRGVVTVETRGFNQRGEEVCYFRRKVMVPKRDAAPSRASGRTSRSLDVASARLPVLPHRRRRRSPATIVRRDRAHGRVPRPPAAVPGPHARRARARTSRRCATCRRPTSARSSPRCSASRSRCRTASTPQGTLRGREQRGQPERPAPPRPRGAAPPQGRAAGLLLAPRPATRTPAEMEAVAAADPGAPCPIA